jgi:hypothetical protein
MTLATGHTGSCNKRKRKNRGMGTELRRRELSFDFGGENGRFFAAEACGRPADCKRLRLSTVPRNTWNYVICGADYGSQRSISRRCCR